MLSTSARSLALALLAALALAGCSPESLRSRGSGPGGDIGNRGATVELHGRTDPAYGVPPVGRAVEQTRR